MLFTRWNKNGSKVNCEQSQLNEMEKNGYEFEECPEKIEKVEQEQKKEVVEPEPKKPTRQTRKKKEESDIVLE